MSGSVLGHAVRRREDPALIKGEATFVTDIKRDRMVHAVFVRSMVPHGRVRHIDTSHVGSDVLGVFGPEDLGMHPQVPYRTTPDEFARHALASVARYVGDPVAVVVAETERAALDGALSVFVDYDELDPVLDPERASEPDAPVLFSGHGSNTALIGSVGAIEDPVVGADVVVQARFVQQRLSAVPMEPGSGVVEPDGNGGVVAWIGTQDPWGTRYDMASMLGLTTDQVRVIVPAMGGGFGPKGDLYPEHAVIAALALRLDRPVRWVERRSVNLVHMMHGRAQVQDVVIGATSDGKVTGLDVAIVADVGAYPAVASWLPEYTLEMLSGTYDIPKIRGRFESVATNRTPCGPYRGAGRPEATQLVERAMDLVAAELGMDRIEVRRKNLIERFDDPHRTATGAVYDTGDYAAVLTRALDVSDHADWVRQRDERRAARDPVQLGIGVSTYVETTVGFTPTHEPGEVVVNADGTIVATAGGSSHGQGHVTAFSQIVADMLDVDMSQVEVRQSDTHLLGSGAGTYASRTVQLAGTSLYESSYLVLAKAQELAAHVCEASPGDIVTVPGRGLAVAGSPDSLLTWAELATLAGEPDRLPPGMAPGLAAASDHDQQVATYPFGAHVAVVEVDTETGRVKLVSHTAVDDAGNIINPMLAGGQQQGGIAQGAGQALMEQVLFDDHGQPMTTNLGSYLIPAAVDLPPLTTLNTVTPTPVNPLGAKGIGEAGTLGSTPAIHSAVMDVLEQYGIRHLDLPLTPSRVWEAIRSAG